MSQKLDLTQGSVYKRILMFSLPLMAGQFLQQLYNTVDGVIVANYASTEQLVCESAVAAVGGSFYLIFLLLAIAIGLSNGAAVIVSQYYGAGKIPELRRAASTLIITLSALGAVISVLGFLFADFLVVDVLAVTDPSVSYLAVTYFKVYSLCFLGQYIYNAVSAVLRAIGDSRASLYFLMVSSILNIILDLVFVVVFKMSVLGVAIGTVISVYASAIFSLVYMRRKYEIFHFTREDFVFDRDMLKLSLNFGVPSIFQQSSVALGNVILQRLVNSFNQVTMSAFAVGMRMESYIMIPILSMSIATSTFAGQNTGAKKYDRVSKAFFASIISCLLISSVVSALVYVFAPNLVGLFNLAGETADQALEQIRYTCVMMLVMAVYMPSNGILQGVGDIMTATFSSFVTLFVRVSMSYVCVYVFMTGYSGIWLPIASGWACGLVICYTTFFRGKWKTKSLEAREKKEEVV